MFTVHRSYDLAILLLFLVVCERAFAFAVTAAVVCLAFVRCGVVCAIASRNGHIFHLVIINSVLIAFAFVLLAVIMDQDMQARTAGTARVSNQIPKSSDMWTVHRSYDLAILLLF